MKLKKLEEYVKKQLEENPATRGDDDLLYYYVLQDMGVNLGDYITSFFILHYRSMGLPTIESVGRCRRKLQEHNKYLCAGPEIEIKRRESAERFLAYAKD